MKQAVTIGCTCGHGSGGQVSTGSSNVFIDGKSMARGDDRHTCPKHGEPTFGAGAAQVLVNGRPALRQGVDPSSCGAVVSRGVPHVWIGEDSMIASRFELKNPPPDPPSSDEARALNSVGFNDEAQARKLCSALKELEKTWPTLGREARRDALEKILNARLAEMGVPPVNLLTATLSGNQAANHNGVFNATPWRITMNENLLNDSTSLSALGKLLAHEGTHGVQFFLMLQYTAFIGRPSARSPLYDGTPAGFAQRLGIPVTVADAVIRSLNELANNKQLEQWEKSREYLAAKLMFSSVLESKGAAYYGEIQQQVVKAFSNPEKYTPEDLKKIQEAYLALPSESAANRAEVIFEKGCQFKQ